MVLGQNRKSIKSVVFELLLNLWSLMEIHIIQICYEQKINLVQTKSEVNKSMLTIIIMILRSHLHCFLTKEIFYGLKENELIEMVK